MLEHLLETFIKHCKGGLTLALKNNKCISKLIRKSRALRVVESAMQLELSSRTETEQEARSKSSCYNFETLSTQIFQCNCFFSAATGPPPSYSSLRDNSRQHQSQRVEILFGGAFLFLFVCIFSTYS